jgi:hypothetical protein
MTQTPQHLSMTYEQLKQSHDEWRMLAMHNYVVAKAAEEREQKLIDIMHIIAFESDDEKTQKYASQMLSTLYPDTPAPKEGTDWLNEESCARCGRNKPVEGYEWCSECRPDLKAKEESHETSEIERCDRDIGRFKGQL